MTNEQIIRFEKYGKAKLHERIKDKVVYRFKKNQYTETLYNKRGLGLYIPKLNKYRFALSLVIVGALIITPFVTALSIPVLLWGIK